MKKKTLILIILSFPITLTIYIFLFVGNIKFEENIIINSNIDTVAMVLNNPENKTNYINEIKEYKLISGERGKKGSKSEIKINTEGNSILLKEKIIHNKLPNEIKISLNADGVHNVYTQKLKAISKDKTKLITIQEFSFTGYMKFTSFFIESILVEQTRSELKNIKSYIESNY